MSYWQTMMQIMNWASMQTEALRYWGKARPARDGTVATPCHLLVHHSLDVAAVGVQALQRWPALRQLFVSRLGLPEIHSEPWLAFWLALHDLGKFAESFQCFVGRPPGAG